MGSTDVENVATYAEPLAGRVVIVTGAGVGLGREHALFMARHGARVVVNDVGVAHDGSGGNSLTAEAVADEIRAAGGEAAANHDDVADWDGSRRLVDYAISRFGRLDALVNNAGIIRDRSIVNMSEEDFDSVVRVHLKGTFCVTRWAARYWRDMSKAGERPIAAVVNTSSGAGLHGNFGQSNYAAAKAGIAALTQTNAAELARYGVRVNAIAPIARTRMTDATPSLAPLVQDPSGQTASRFEAANVAPVVAYLASSICRFSGQVFSVYGGELALYEGWSLGKRISTEATWTLTSLAEAALQLPLQPELETQHSLLAG